MLRMLKVDLILGEDCEDVSCGSVTKVLVTLKNLDSVLYMDTVDFSEYVSG
jgi:hypothetical protein